MKPASLVSLGVVTGAVLGYATYPLLHEVARVGVRHEVPVRVPHDEPAPDRIELPTVPSSSTVLAACEFSSEQLERLVDRLAPAVVERLAASGLKSFAPDPKVAATERLQEDTKKAEQVDVFNRATAMVDRMIGNHQIDQEGMRNARELLQQTGQTDRIYLLDARISAALNRGDMTPVQAGLVPPSQ